MAQILKAILLRTNLPPFFLLDFLLFFRQGLEIVFVAWQSPILPFLSVSNLETVFVRGLQDPHFFFLYLQGTAI